MHGLKLHCFYFEVVFIHVHNTYIKTYARLDRCHTPSKMSAHAKRRKVDAECRVFNKNWTAKYLFTEVVGKAVCLVCGEQIAVFKDYNVSRHYQTKHAEKCRNLTVAQRARTSEALLAKLQKQQGLFTKLHTSRDAATKTSFVISHKIAKYSKPFSEGGVC